MVKKTPEATEAYNENQLCGLFVFFEKKKWQIFPGFWYKVLLYFQAGKLRHEML